MAFELDKHTGVLIKKAARLFERAANINLDELGITYAQTIFLVRLWEKDGQNQLELTKSSGLQQPSVVRILDRMVRDKLIKKIRSQADKRMCHFYLTEKAKKACKALEKQGTRMQKIATVDMRALEIDELHQKLQYIIQNLQNFLETAAPTKQK